MLAVHQDAKDDHATGTGLETDLGIEALVLAIRPQHDDAVGVSAKTFVKMPLADPQGRAVGGDIKSQRPPALRRRLNEFRPVA